LPVVGETGALIGLVDVLELTYGVMTRAGRDFWSSSLDQIDDDTASIISAKRSSAPATHATSPNVSPSRNELAGAHRANPDESMRSETSMSAAGAGSFLFKVKDDRGNMHRLQSSASKFDVLTKAVAAKLLDKSEFLLKYKDDEGDEVTLSSDESLAEAVSMAIEVGWKVLHLSVSDTAAAAAAAAGGGRVGASHGTNTDEETLCLPFTDQRVSTTQAALGAAALGGVLLIGILVAALSRRSR
jgi:hypothetical protein